MNVGTGKCDRSALRVIRALRPDAGGFGFFCSIEGGFRKKLCRYCSVVLLLVKKLHLQDMKALMNISVKTVMKANRSKAED